METVRAVKKVLVVVGAALVVGYLLISRSLWFPDLERQIRVGRDRLTKAVDLRKPATITWKIPGEAWKYQGECQVALVLEKIPAIPWKAYRKESMALQVKMDAYAITYNPTAFGNRIEGIRANRLIRNWYFITDTPLSPEARIWEFSGASGVELGLCGVQRYPWEDTYVVFEILRPDPVLAEANPKLQIVGEYDYAVYGHIWPLRIFRDTVLLFLNACVIGLAYAAFKRI